MSAHIVEARKGLSCLLDGRHTVATRLPPPDGAPNKVEQNAEVSACESTPGDGREITEELRRMRMRSSLQKFIHFPPTVTFNRGVGCTDHTPETRADRADRSGMKSLRLISYRRKGRQFVPPPSDN